MAAELNDDAIRRFFGFMAKREALRLKRESGASWPWSDDPILNAYRFTNVKREHDRTTRWMREHWTGPNIRRPAGEIVFNCAFFRYFGTSEFAAAIGWRRRWNPQRVIRIAADRVRHNKRVFTGAYIIPTLGCRRPKHEVVCLKILTPLWAAKEQLGKVAVSTRSWQKTAEALSLVPGFGGSGFMAKEVLQDVMQTPVLSDAIDKNSWCPAGPGAQRGLNRIFARPVGSRVPLDQAILEMGTLHSLASQCLPSYMPELELHDIQFQLCEFDKYERARLKQGRLKRRYVPSSAMVE